MDGQFSGQGHHGQNRKAEQARAAEPPETAHHLLRRLTRDAHAATEHAFAPFDLATRHGLGLFLTAQAAAIMPIEHALERTDVGRLLPDWDQRRRSLALRADLAALALSPAWEPMADLAGASDSYRLGMVYVLEGSRLGASILRRIVAGSPDPLVQATLAFLDHTPGPRGWRRFLDRLDTMPSDADTKQHLGAGALAAFAVFQKAADRVKIFAEDTSVASESSTRTPAPLSIPGDRERHAWQRG